MTLPEKAGPAYYVYMQAPLFKPKASILPVPLVRRLLLDLSALHAH
jgi:hypothetical protein